MVITDKFMLTNLHRGKFLAIIFITLISCTNKTNDSAESYNYTNSDKLLNRALSKSYYKQIQKNIGLCISGSDMYFLTDSKNGFKNDKFLLHFVNEDNTFLNKDFRKEDFLQDDSLYNKFKNLSIIRVPFENQNFKYVRVGQYQRLEDGSAKNIWVEAIDMNEITSNTSFYKNEFQNQINKNLLNENFEAGLQFGAFFRNSNGVYILYESDFIYVMVNKTDNFEDKFMLHFINEANTFINKSFFLKDMEIQNHLESPYSKLRIARIPLPREPFVKIRIGQYNMDGNIWMQEFSPEDILGNPLLKYNNEFQNYEP